MDAEMRKRGMNCDFRATGQTGILITGGGVPVDAVVADFMAGSIEWLTPDNDEDHWDLIEGQGSLFHVSYSGVTLALIHGGQPDALILCHEPTRTHMRGLPSYDVPTLERLRDVALPLAQVGNPDCKPSEFRSYPAYERSEAEPIWRGRAPDGLLVDLSTDLDH